LDQLLISIGVAFAALFPIVDPIGNVPTFLGLTQAMDADERKDQALKAVAAAVAILVLFLTIGNFILEYFGISLAAVEVVGGLVLGYAGWQMLAQPIESQHPEEDDSDADIYFTPMAFPLLAGPGALATVLAFSNRTDHWLDYPGFLIGIVLVLAVTYLSLAYADRVLSRLGPKGVEVLNRIMGLIVLLIAAELLFHGVADEFGLHRFGD
jgi:multiple antibiotic resistance protein